MNAQREAYKAKLLQFNSTEKYRNEVDFMLRLMDPKPGEKILDYGCGLGNLVWDLVDNGFDAYGHDIINYREKDDLLRFRTEYSFKFDKVFMMHSIAHIPEIEEKLRVLKEGLNKGGKVFVITPNFEWLIQRGNQKPDYKPDPTVIQHFHQTDLRNLFLNAGFKVDIYGQFGDCCDSSRSIYTNERLFLEAQYD